MRLIAFLFIALMAISPRAYAEIETYTLEKPHTQIIFSVSHLGFSHSYGKFTDFDGTIIFDRGQPEKSKVEAVIRTASIEMNDQKWNEHMIGKDFFNVEAFPEMTFKSINILKTGDKTAKLSGELTLLGVTKPVTLDVVFNKADKHPMKDIRMAGFSATGKIKRSDFGMSYGLPMVGDDVNIILEVEAIQESAKATN
ncbi:MAG: polyisoprenoid-binding protein [Alphaproteobacteria bacterium]|nr:polyisoprenoid-binding protein [Alphaproteobacteria bacterium]